MADAPLLEEQSSVDAVPVGSVAPVISQGYVYNNTTFDRHRSVIGDAQAAIGIAATAGMLYNGTNYDRPRSGGVTGMAGVSGDTANAAADAGNPVKIGGRAQASAPTAVTAGQRANAWFGLNGQLMASLVDPGGAAQTVVKATTDGSTAPSSLYVAAIGMLNNTSTLDMAREVIGDTQGATGIAAAALMGYNGSSYDRVRVANTGRLQVDVQGANDAGDGLGGGTTFKVAGYVLNGGGSWDRVRAANADAQAATGLSAAALMGYNGATFDRVRVANTGRLQVDVITGGGAGTQYTEDAALGAVGTGIGGLQVARASAAAPTSVSADADAVGVWASRFGALNIIPRDTAGAALTTVAAALADAFVNPTVGGGSTFGMLYNGASWDRSRSAVGVTGATAVAGPTAGDAALAAAPITIGGRASTALPTAMSADNDVVDLWLSRNGATNAILRDTAGAALSTTAAALSDTFANPTIGGIQTFGMLYDTADNDWDRARAVSGDAQTNEGISAAGLTGYNGSTYDRARLIAALDAAPNVDTGILAVGSGPGWDRKQNPAGVAATSTANAVTVEVDGADVIVFAFTTIGVTPGSMIIETSSDDGTTWVTSGSVLKLGAETWVSGAFVPAVGDIYMCRVTGIRRIRVRVNAVYASGTVTVKWTSSVGVGLIKGMDLAPQPHNIGQSVLNYQSASLGVTTSGVAITATAGKRVYITNIRCNVGGTTAGSLAIYSGTGAFTEGTSQTAFFAEFAPLATSKPGAIIPFSVPWASATVNEDIRITTVGLTATHIQIEYYIA